MKAERRLEAKHRKSDAPAAPPGVDPDIAGIVPGPQPSPWGDDLLEPAEAEENDEA